MEIPKMPPIDLASLDLFELGRKLARMQDEEMQRFIIGVDPGRDITAATTGTNAAQRNECPC